MQLVTKTENMKRFILFVVALASFAAYAQTLKFYYNDVEIHESVDMVVSDPMNLNEFALNILNNTDNDLSINFTKENIFEATGSYNTFCLGSCMEPTVMESLFPLELAAHTMSTAEDFHFVYSPGNSGEPTRVKYTFLVGDESFPILVNFLSAPSSITERTSVTKLNAYPNPCTTQVDIQYELGNVGATQSSLIITNLLGKKIQTLSLEGNTGKVTLDLSQIPAGIYFYSLETNGRLVSTKKLVVR